MTKILLNPEDTRMKGTRFPPWERSLPTCYHTLTDAFTSVTAANETWTNMEVRKGGEWSSVAVGGRGRAEGRGASCFPSSGWVIHRPRAAELSGAQDLLPAAAEHPEG